MVVVLAADLNPHWLELVRRCIGDRCMLLPVEGSEAAVDAARRLPVRMMVSNMEPLTTDRLRGLMNVNECEPEVVTVCIGPQDVREQVRNDGLVSPQFWLANEADRGTVRETLNNALLSASMQHNAHSPAFQSASVETPHSFDRMNVSEPEVFHRIMSALAGRFDSERLLATYVEAVVELTKCASYCLLVREPDAEALRVQICKGLHPGVAMHGRLVASDALVRWYNANSRVLTRDELAGWEDRALAGAIRNELDVLRGQVVIPLIVNGRLECLLILGEKAVAGTYGPRELETLFVITGYVSLQLENLHLGTQVEHTKIYMERSLSGMLCGLVTLGRDQRIVLCNPYAATILGVRRDEVEGNDIRCLPSPLGDYLYNAFISPHSAKTAEEIELSSRDMVVRVSTSALMDDFGRSMGSVMLIEDITAPVARANAEKRREHLEALTHIVGRIAHGVKTSLTAIQTYSHLMDGPQDHQELGDFWQQTVKPELTRLDSLMEQMVQVVQQPEPNFQLVRLEKIVEAAIEEMNGETPEAHFIDNLSVRSALSRVVADPAPTREAISYLLAYLCAQGTPPVSVEIGQDSEGEADRVYVAMRTSAQNRNANVSEILDPLFALQQPDGDLGPAISQQIVDRQGGKIVANGENGHIEFRVVFPVTVNEVLDASGE